MRSKKFKIDGKNIFYYFRYISYIRNEKKQEIINRRGV